MAVDSFLEVFKEEVKQQWKFALIVWEDMATRLQDPLKGLTGDGKDRFWNSVQAFLAACANISKMCWPSDRKAKGETSNDVAFRVQRGEEIRKLLGLTEESALKSKSLRNHFEHFDERLDLWARTSPNGILISRCIGDPGEWAIPVETGMNDTMGFYDTLTNTVTFQGTEAFELNPMILAVRQLYASLPPTLYWEGSSDIFTQ